MPITNFDIADTFERVADLLEIEDAEPWRILAYRNAAREVATLPDSLRELVAAGGDVTDIHGIGEGMGRKLLEIVRTGRLSDLEEIGRRLPVSLVGLLSVPGLGPKRVRLLHEALGVVDRESLAQAAREGKVRKVRGFGSKTEAKILERLERSQPGEGRLRLVVAEQIAEPLVRYLAEQEGVLAAAVAGSYRRRKETIGNLNVVAMVAPEADAIGRLVAYEDVVEVLERSDAQAKVRLRQGLPVLLRQVETAGYGAALLQHTGAQAHHKALRALARQGGLRLDESGLWRGDERIAGASEVDAYAALGLPPIAPELREGRGEVEAALAGRLPAPVGLEDVRGDLHVHTDASDGHRSLLEMALACRDRGYEYMAVTDHSPGVGVTNGLDAGRLRQQIALVDELNAGLDGFTILKGSEVDILVDGSLALPNDVLAELDLTVCSIHTHLALAREQQTERVMRAMDNPHFSIYAHPTERQIGRRPPLDLDIERLMRSAAERGVHMEVNAQPDRLDLDDVHCQMARELGLKIAISTDAHRVVELGYMRFGIYQARRGWLEAKDILNTYPLPALRAALEGNESTDYADFTDETTSEA